jgi:5'-nucleotidase
MSKPQILLTNDDGIQSPGLWAAAEALSALGFVHVVAPRDQFSGAGRSLPSTSDGMITEQSVVIHGKEWTGYSIGGTPAQAVLHGMLEIMPSRPDLVVSGINYGENLGIAITVSGTVGAALEAAAQGIPALAVSLETDISNHLSYSAEIDFQPSAYFTQLFAHTLLEKKLPADVDVLKVDIPQEASITTPWQVTCLTRQPYFTALPPRRIPGDSRGPLGYKIAYDPNQDSPDTDAYVVRKSRLVSVTPISLDLTSRVDLIEFARLLSAGKSQKP